MNSFLHLGHGYLAIKTDIRHRYLRQFGESKYYIAFHATGAPVPASVAAARAGDSRAKRLFRDRYGPDVQVPSCEADWVKIHIQAAKSDLSDM